VPFHLLTKRLPPQTPIEEVEAMASLVQRCMEEASKLDLPLPVSVKVGERIGSLKPYSPEEQVHTSYRPLSFVY
jgi:hypothetical protein